MLLLLLQTFKTILVNIFFRIIYESVREKAQEVLGENKIAPAEFDMIVNYFANAIVGQ